MTRNRKTYRRECVSCGKAEMVRPDQKGMTCAACRKKEGGRLLSRYVKENPESCGKASRKHGMRNHRLYRIHKSMRERCGHMSTRHKFACYYEDRGIRVCDEWLDKNKFFEWAFSNGYADDLQIDRIDNDKGYSPDNCRWVTPTENQRNRRDR